MSETEIVEYLLRWLMEFGTDASTYEERMRNTWYFADRTQSYKNERLNCFFEESRDNGLVRSAKLNQAGLDLIRNYHERNGDR